MTEWAKFVSGVMFLDYTSGRMPFRSLPLSLRQSAVRGAPCGAPQQRAHQTREARLT